MDHSGMDHSGMDHGDMDHGHGHDGMDDMCKMNMLFNWDTTGFCVVFREWHIRSTFSLIFSIVAVILLGVGYEGLRALSRRYEQAMAQRVEALPRQNRDSAGQRAHIIKGVLYALQNFYGLMLMLVFMTYNGWIMISVSVGAFAGYIIFGMGLSSTKEEMCH